MHNQFETPVATYSALAEIMRGSDGLEPSLADAIVSSRQDVIT
jgi:hypothetical protein